MHKIEAMLTKSIWKNENKIEILVAGFTWEENKSFGTKFNACLNDDFSLGNGCIAAIKSHCRHYSVLKSHLLAIDLITYMNNRKKNL